MAVQGVSSEPVSADFPVKQGKNREFLRITPESGPRTRGNALIFPLFLVEFPTRRNREFFQPNREFSRDNRETHLQIRERLNSLVAGSNPRLDLFKNVPPSNCERPSETALPPVANIQAPGPLFGEIRPLHLQVQT